MKHVIIVYIIMGIVGILSASYLGVMTAQVLMQWYYK